VSKRYTTYYCVLLDFSRELLERSGYFFDREPSIVERIMDSYGQEHLPDAMPAAAARHQIVMVNYPALGPEPAIGPAGLPSEWFHDYGRVYPQNQLPSYNPTLPSSIPSWIDEVRPDSVDDAGDAIAEYLSERRHVLQVYLLYPGDVTVEIGGTPTLIVRWTGDIDAIADTVQEAVPGAEVIPLEQTRTVINGLLDDDWIQWLTTHNNLLNNTFQFSGVLLL
jgi:hypothetical protein